MLTKDQVQAVRMDTEGMNVTTKSESQPDTRLAVSIPELSELTGLSEGLLYAKANQGSLPGCRRIGKRFLVSLSKFMEWLDDGMGEEVGE